MTNICCLMIGAVGGYLWGRGFIDRAIVVGMMGFALVILGPVIFPPERP